MANHTNYWGSRQELFRTMPLRSFLVFCLAVAFTFAAIGVVSNLFDLEPSDSKHLFANALTISSLSTDGCLKQCGAFSLPLKFFG